MNAVCGNASGSCNAYTERIIIAYRVEKMQNVCVKTVGTYINHSALNSLVVSVDIRIET